MKRMGVHQLSTTGADATKDTPRYNPATGKVEWAKPAVTSIPSVKLDDLTDVVVAGTQTIGDTLRWDGTNFVPMPNEPAYSDLSDVDMTSVAPGNVAQWNGADWVPSGFERVIVLPAGATELPAGSPARALVVRRAAT